MEKKNTGMKISIVILCLLVIGLSAYIVYDKVLNKDNDKYIENNEEQNETDTDDDTVDKSGEGDNFDVVVGDIATMNNFDLNEKCFNGCGKIVKIGQNEVMVFADGESLKIGNKEVLNLNESWLSIKQVTIYKDIVIVSTPTIEIYNLNGNLLKEVGQFKDESNKLFVAYLWYNDSEDRYAFNVTEDGKIQFIGTKHTQGAVNTYMDDNGNPLDLCSSGSHISDDAIVSGIFEFAYLGDGKFGDINYISTRSTVKDLKHCN